ncbi:TonB-dependent receptor [Parabacteroides sp. Marseille-P3160]|uniref:TonB-dependent receptor n=1 Tax=Parabacteroides sp. Marseille-P3160 TaxID=1917887 RepID=UPI001F2D4F6E|nr:TonB-dependent receptor [Parabacteroides sp. Marseille-P3160]
MRIIIVLLCAFVFQMKAEHMYSQQTKVSLDIQNSSLEKVLQTIEEKSDYYFLYNSKLINVDRKVNIHVKNETIASVLDKLFNGENVKYEVKESQIILSPKNMGNTTPEFGVMQEQRRVIKGKVTDEGGEPIIGANILEVGNNSNGTVTDVDGNFSLNVAMNAKIRVSYIGYLEQDISIGGKTTFDIVLRENTKTLDEVIVVGYGTQKKVNMTGSITAIKADDLSTIATPNLSNTLAGRAPGINITGNSGLMGSSSEIRFRGGFGDPLFVIDGIIRDKAAFDALEANEVDQMSFLKDAATASIYGSQAGNGVVLVTTKSGGTTVQKPIFNYQGSYTFSAPTMELLSDKTTAIDELIYQNRVAEFQGNKAPNGDVEFAYFADKNYNVNDYIWQTPWNTKHSLNVSGASDKISYYALASYIGEEGSYKHLENEKFNLRSNVTAKITDYIKMNLNIAANQQNQRRFYWPFSGDDEQTVGDLYRCTFNWPKTYPFYLYADGTPANEITEYPVQTPMGSWQAWSVIDQVISDERYIKTRQREMNTILSFDVNLDFILKGLSTKFSANYIGNDYSRKKYMTYQKNYVWTPKNADENRFIPAPPNPDKINIFTFSQNQENLQYGLHSLWSEQLNWFLNYNQSFGKHDVSGSLIWEQASNRGEKIYVTAESPLTYFDQLFVYSTDSERRYGDGNEVNGGRLSWIGRFNYTYDKKYITEFSFRYDGNSLFPEEKRWGFFPSISAAWRISSESFMEGTSDWLNDLKLRASYGTAGNDLDLEKTLAQKQNVKITPFSYIPTYVSGSPYIFGSSLNLGIKPGDTPNPYITWATSKTLNGGLDFSVFKNRLNGSLDVFYKKESDILGTRIVTLPDTYGQSLAPENYAERSWRGFEINAQWRDRMLDGRIQYSVYGNLGYSHDQWDVLDQTALYKEGGNLEDLDAIGHPLNRIIGLKTVGMVRTQEQLDELLAKGFTQYGRSPYLGGLIFEDIRSEGYSKGADGKIDGNDIQLLSDKASPRINYGFGGNVSWKGISVDVHFQGVGDYDRIVSNLEGGGFRQHGGAIRPYYPIWADDVWTPENPNAKYPRPVGQNWYESGTGVQSFWIRSGAYLRLKNLNIGYDLPKNIVSMFGLISAQLFFNGSNLFVISPMTEFHDPEQDCYDSYPLMKSFTFGLNVKF